MKSESPLWRHSELYHGGGDFEVEVEVLKSCFGKPSRRMITESVMIEQLGDRETMNSKQEWTKLTKGASCITWTKLNKVRVA